MDTAKLELAAQRHREAEAALDAARTDLQAEAVAALQQDPQPGAHAEISRITGWSRTYVRRLARRAGR
ncbi:hypothetical protein [Streptomyces fuscigenes]|uniref:hypothetical protein n=1 Tax=Streptomyces fuscigenes TaxID=1528880 RepID=UPI001F3DF050|nr:hypothetical protein [Streptomyces fuscigenes]MCF3962444.1 hypothetical protein [Streptomyces fuscigenes]